MERKTLLNDHHWPRLLLIDGANRMLSSPAIASETKDRSYKFQITNNNKKNGTVLIDQSKLQPHVHIFKFVQILHQQLHQNIFRCWTIVPYVWCRFNLKELMRFFFLKAWKKKYFLFLSIKYALQKVCWQTFRKSTILKDFLKIHDQLMTALTAWWMMPYASHSL